MMKHVHILLALVVTLGLLAAAPATTARADCSETTTDNWNCTGADTDGMDASASGTTTDTVTVVVGASVDNPDVGAAAITVADGSVTNDGSISANALAGTGVLSSGAADVVNASGGTVDANGLAGQGIVTRDGDVTNAGSVTADGDFASGVVTETGNVTNSGTISAGGDSGTAIATGGGDNTVTNSGTVSATGNDGIAINTGDGSDTVTLASGSSTSGGAFGTGLTGCTDDLSAVAVCTGDGSDTVTLNVGAAVSGIIAGGGGTDTLQFGAFTPSQLAGLNPAVDSFGGYSWIDFEQLLGLFSPPSGDDGHGRHHKHDKGPQGPHVYFRSHKALGLGSGDNLGIDVFAEPGKIAFIPFADLGAIDLGEAPVRFQVQNSDDWYVEVSNLGPFAANPAHDWYLVAVHDGDGKLVSEEHFDH